MTGLALSELLGGLGAIGRVEAFVNRSRRHVREGIVSVPARWDRTSHDGQRAGSV